MDNTQAQYPATGRFFYDSGDGFVYVCQGPDQQDDVILKDVLTATVKVVSPRAIGGTFRTVHDVAKSSVKADSRNRYMGVDTALHSMPFASREVAAEDVVGLPASVAVFDLVGMDEYFVKSLERHASKVLVAL